jgi:hypothetical protein
MLNYSDLTVVRNNEGLPTALGYTINSLMLHSNKPLFVGGGGKRKPMKNHNSNDDDMDFEHLAVPTGLVCMTETICARPVVTSASRSYPVENNNEEYQTVPDGLYEKLMVLAETKPPKKLSRNKNMNKKHKNKTHKRKQ